MNPDARIIAFKLLNKFFKTHTPLNYEQLYKLENRKLVSFIRNLVSTVLRHLRLIDYSCKKLTGRKLRYIPLDILTILRLGLAELYFMKSIPEYTTVNSYVNLVNSIASKTKSLKKTKGFVNAILRKATRYPVLLQNCDNFLIKYSFPQYLVRLIKNRFGKKSLIKNLEIFNTPPELYLRVNLLKIKRNDLAHLFSEHGLQAFLIKGVKTALKLKSTHIVEDLPCFEDGYFYLQNPSSQLVSEWGIDTKKCKTLLDICCGVGGKLTHSAEILKNRGFLTGTDISFKKLKKLKENLNRLGITNVKVICADSLNLNIKYKFDTIIVDPPCSAYSTIRKHPEIKWIKRNPSKFQKLQLRFLNKAYEFLNKGGKIIYSVCTFTSQETDEVIEEFIKSHNDIKLIKKYLNPPTYDFEPFFISIMEKK